MQYLCLYNDRVKNIQAKSNLFTDAFLINFRFKSCYLGNSANKTNIIPKHVHITYVRGAVCLRDLICSGILDSI